MIDIDVITLHDGDYYIIDSAIKDNIKYLLLSKTDDFENILIRSMMMTNAEWHSDEKKSNKMALFFALVGSIFLVGLWVGTAILEANFSDVSNALPYRVFYYILDILITVILWEALTIYFVKKNEDRAKHISINRRLNVVTFKKIDEKEE